MGTPRTVHLMDNRDEVKSFLSSRRQRLTPEQVGILVHSGQRRVKGLRREEVAALASVSTDYYTRMERGNLAGVSQPVLDAIARALRLDEAERTHLLHLADAANAGTRTGPAKRIRKTVSRPAVREGIRRMLGSISTPAYVRDQRGEVLAMNHLARALFADVRSEADGTFNMSRFLFLDDRARSFFADWPEVARASVAGLRAEAGRNPFDQELTNLVGELCTRSEEFRTGWAAHQVKPHVTATKTMRHSVAGDITLTGEALELPGDAGLLMIVYTVEPGSASEHALAFLASWSTQDAIF